MSRASTYKPGLCYCPGCDAQRLHYQADNREWTCVRCNLTHPLQSRNRPPRYACACCGTTNREADDACRVCGYSNVRW